MPKPAKKKKIKEQLWVVSSYNDDQQEDFLDLVPAVDEDSAKEFVSNLRPYAVAVCAQTARQQLKYAKWMMRQDVTKFKKNLAKYYKSILDESDLMICPECEKIAAKNGDDVCVECQDKLLKEYDENVEHW